ncbi:MAG: IclR family transcriptional regulator [Steroidobacteraceae bacterium]
MDSPNPRGSGARLVALLTAIAEGGTQFSLKDLGGRVRLPASTVHRLLRVLVRSGMVERGRGQSYRPGRELYRMAWLLRAKFDVGTAARPLLERLWTRWRETTVLAVYNPARRRATVQEIVLTQHPLRFVLEPGAELALPWGSLGRAILAQLPGEDRDAILASAGSGPLSGRSLPKRATLRAELEQIRARGVAVYFDPAFELAGVAAPVFGRDHRLFGCVGVIMPTRRFERQSAPAMSKMVTDVAGELSKIIALSE